MLMLGESVLLGEGGGKEDVLVCWVSSVLSLLWRGNILCVVELFSLKTCFYL